ncbi:MAG TPA: PEP-CTERM sorting domain-containing protein [Phycisphaerae bacterium]|nr:PEP-CTERM sorting domain-containing protein [Phycisphaerae bacterium]
MHARNLSAVSAIALVSMVAFLGILPIPATQAAMIYTWDRGASNNNWPVAANWDAGGDPPTPPGSVYSGAVDDQVTIDSASVGANVTVNLGTDAGTIDSLQIGGGGNLSTLQLNNAASNLTVTNNVTLGTVTGGNNRVGNLTVGTAAAQYAQMTVEGNIVSGSPADSDITINGGDGGGSAVLTLYGDIDSVGVHEIDLTIQRGNLNLAGAGAQALYVEEFNLADIGNNIVTTTWTLGPDKTLVVSARADIGRNSSTATQQNKTVTGTLNIYGGTATFNAGTDTLILGNVGTDPNGGTTTADGTINVGDATNAGTLNVNGELRLAPIQNDTRGGAQVAAGTLNVDNAGSVVTITGGIEMADNGDEFNAGTVATVTINNGLVTVYEHIEDGVNQSTINLNGGTLHLATVNPTLRAVDTLNFSGGTMTFTGEGGAAGGPKVFQATALSLGANPGDSTIDLAITQPLSGASAADQIAWVGGTGTWDGTAANKWDANPNNGAWILPSQGAYVLFPGLTYTVLEDTGDAVITNQGNAVLTAGADVDWDLDQSAAGNIKIVRTNTTVAGVGPATAVIDGAASIVTRNANLYVAAITTGSPDAAAVRVSNSASLTLDDPADIDEPDLILNGNSNTDRLDQEVLVESGGTLVLNGNLIFGGAAGEPGGTFRMTGGTVNVAGHILEGLADGTPDTSITSAQFMLDGGTLTVGGDINPNSFRLGDNPGTSGAFALAAGKNLSTNGSLTVGNAGTGQLINNGGTVSAGNDLLVANQATGVGTFTQNSGTTTTGNGGVDIGGAAGAVGAFNLVGGTFRTGGDGLRNAEGAGSTGTVVIGGSGLNPTLVVAGANFESANNGTGTVTVHDGTIYQNNNNFIINQGDASNATVTFHGGTYDLRGEGASGTGNDLNFNSGTGVLTVNAGATVYAADVINMTNNASGNATFTISGGDVFVRNNLSTRANGTDTVNLSSGNLIFGNLPGHFQGADVVNEILFDTGSSDTFNWTGGMLAGVDNITGVASLQDTGAGDAGVFHQRGGTFAVVGGTTNIDDDYRIDGGATIDAYVVASAPGAAIVIGNTVDPNATADFNAAASNYNLNVIVVDPGDTTDPSAATWDNGGGLNTWDLDKTNWNIDRLPAAGKALGIGTVYTVVDSKNTLTGTPLNANVSAGWAVSTQNGDATDDDLVVTTTAAVEYGAVKAILPAGATVTRNSDLLIHTGVMPTRPADAAALELQGGAGSSSLTLSGTSNLVLGADGPGSVVQDGDVTIGGDLRFGPADIDWPFGGMYTINGGNLVVNGSIVTNAQFSNQTGGVADRSLLAIDVVEDVSNGMAVAGGITVEAFIVGNADGATGSWTLPDGRTVAATDDLIAGEFGSGAMTVGGGGAGANVTVGDDLFVAHADPAAGTTVSSLTINQNSVVNVGDQMRLGISDGSTSTLTLNGGTLIVGGTFVDSDENGSNSVLNINSGTLTVGGIMYLGDDQGLGTGQSTAYIGVGGGAPSVSVSQLRVGQWSPATLIMESGTLASAQGTVGVNGTGALEIRGGTATFTSEVRAGDVAGSNGTIKVGEFGGNPTIVVSGGNTEIPEDGIGTFELYTGTWYQDTDNFVQGQSDATQSTVKIFGGTLDLTGQAGTHTGQWNVNDGTSTADILGGVVRIGGALQLTDGANDVLAFTIGDDQGANPLVLLGINGTDGINYRNNGTDTINLRSGMLDLTSGIIDADTTGTNAFNWTGGTLKDVSEFQGSLVQGNADSPSLLRIGASPGIMSVTADYTLAAAGTHKSVLEIEIFGDGTGGAGVDFDQLIVTGTADLDASSDIALILDGYTPVLNDQWDILDAGAIAVLGNVNDLFDTSQAPLDPGLYWDLGNFATDGTIKVMPEPATLALMALGGLGLLVRRNHLGRKGARG